MSSALHHSSGREHVTYYVTCSAECPGECHLIRDMFRRVIE